ncbi:MAG: hypothetical protein M1820_000832 [Bogoriella megaspora]|nr:MAG: hypothetical protein M1820_000832 [Bogoriella megaspora]
MSGIDYATVADPDVWIGVKDPKKRKQIQDRLAQRARRKRLAQASGSSNSESCTRRPSRGANKGSPSNSSDEASEQSPNLCQGCALIKTPAIPPMTTRELSSLPVPMTIFTALYVNGDMMGLKCSSVIPARSKEFGPEIPESLRPTALQRMTIHPTWIDRFPFPHMRDNTISLLGIVNEEELLRDFFTMPSFTLEPGGASWDPKVWRMEEVFAKKWGYLFY